MVVRLVVALAVVAIAVSSVALGRLLRRRREFTTESQRATLEVLRRANLAAPALRSGLNASTATKAAPHLRLLLANTAVALTSETEVLGWDGGHEHHRRGILTAAQEVFENGRSRVLQPSDVACQTPECPIRGGVIVPIIVSEQIIGTLASVGSSAGPAAVEIANEVAAWVATQIQLAELQQSRTRLALAELRALRAQISPHFIYNALTAIASFTRSDPERARALLLDFADFTRYTLSSRGDFTTVADELRSIERYLTLERARFGDRLTVTVTVSPEVLGVPIPFLVVQPLVENAIQHGIERKQGPGRLTVTVSEVGNECNIVVEDDGVGSEPGELRRLLAQGLDSEHHGLANIDTRLRSIYGASRGLHIETGIDAGTKVIIRLPKYRAGVRAS